VVVTYIEKLANEIYKRVNPGRSLPNDERGLYLIYAVLALTIGDQVTRRNVHDAWSAWKATTDPHHESVQPFDELDGDVQSQDQPFVRAIREVAGDLDGPPK
jgi:hypothetical protein